MRFRILGPLSVYDGSGWVGIGSAKSRLMLATLLIRAGAVVSLEQVISELWGDDPPKSAATQVHGYVMRLRRLLGDRDGHLLKTEAPGYRLVIGRQDVDVQLFDSHLDKGEKALRDGDNERAVMLFGAALALWRGAPLSDVDSTQLVTDEAGRLTERRLTAWESRTDAELALGQHAMLIGELRHHVEAHPLRERPWCQLMLALYRGGRQAEALQAFHQLRRTFLDELGVEPSAGARELHQRLLAGEVQAPPAPPAQVPRQLPAAPRFVGRAHELELLNTNRGRPIAITGPAGVGKTALAAYWANLVSDRFPDGQLYVNLRGHDPNPSVAPAAVLAHFLQALGVPGTEVPRDLAGRSDRYRELLAGRRVLVFLDNASGAEQVRPLLPDAASCLTLITSRHELRELDAARLRLGVLSDADAVGLLTSVLGAERATGDAVAELASLCGHLPLALRIAAANLAARPQQTIEGHIADLREGNRLTELSVPGDRQAAVRAAFDLSYASLSTSDQMLFRRLGLVPGVDFTPAVAAALLDGPESGALERLAAAHVIEPGAAGRYALHDLVRIYAGERVADDPGADAARRRLFDHYLGMARGAAGLLNPQLARIPLPDEEPAGEFGGYDEALAWLDAERANLTAMIRGAAGGFSWRLVYALRSYFWTRRTGDDWVELAHAGLAAAEADSSEVGRAAMYLSLGHAHWCVGDYRDAIEHYTQARSYCKYLGWRLGESSALNGLAVAFGQLGQLEQTIDYLTKALRIDEEQGARDNVARRLNNLGFALQNLGRLEEAADHYRQSLATRRELGDDSGQWTILNHLAQIHRLLGEPDKALELLDEALKLGARLGSHHATSVTLRNIATVHHDCARHDLARAHAEQALPLARDSGDHEVHVGVLNVLGEALAGLGEYDEADRRHAEVLEITSVSGFIQGRVEALIGLSTLRGRQGRPDAAAELATEALTLAHQHKLRVTEGRAHLELATALAELGHRDQAVDHARQALEVQRGTGHRPGEERAVALLDRLSPRGV